VHLLWSTSTACPAARPCLNLSVRARARLAGFSQGLRPRVQRRFRVHARASPCLGQGLCGRRSSSPPTCVDAARLRSVRTRQGLRQASAAACLLRPLAAFAPPPRPCGARALPRLPCRSVRLCARVMPSRPARLAPSREPAAPACRGSVPSSSYWTAPAHPCPCISPGSSACPAASCERRAPRGLLLRCPAMAPPRPALLSRSGLGPCASPAGRPCRRAPSLFQRRRASVAPRVFPAVGEKSEEQRRWRPRS
jgi:hypothetical protein